MNCGVAIPASLGFDWGILLSLLFVLVVSVVVFNWQVRRWTTNRGWRALLDWARATGFRLSRPRDAKPPDPLSRLPDSRMTTLLASGRTQILQLQTLAGGAIATPRWHVLVRELPAGAWPVTGLRPAASKTSLLDQFSLRSFPGMGEVERFVIYGVDTSAASLLSKSQARALLPPDIGLLLAGTHLVLDFSARPFDPIELGRMNALAEQLVTHLPAGG